jgi:fructose-1,6-bisphosphatase/inositol monophosphatase family enzyme
VDADSVLQVLLAAARAVGQQTATCEDWGVAGNRPGQYAVDLVADAAALSVLHAAGFSVLSEESGRTDPVGSESRPGPAGGNPLAVLDPIDGSTNAVHGLRPYSTSICVFDADGPWVGLVYDHPNGISYEAVRGGGARRDGRPMATSGCSTLSEAIVAVSGFPDRALGWAQFRAFGAASLELCFVAEGSLDGFARAGGSSLYPWDYLAGLLICQEAGGAFADLGGDDLVVADSVGRAPAAGASGELLQELVAALGANTEPGIRAT